MTEFPQPAPQPAAPQPAAPQPAAPQAPELERHHVHHSYIWLGSIQVAVTMFVVMLISIFSSVVGSIAEGERMTSSDYPILLIIVVACVVGFLLVVGIIFLVQWWSYRHLYYQLGTEEFNLYSGIFNKKRVHVPYQRIQSVDQRATLMQRIFGVCTVSIDTAGGSNNKAVQVPYVSKMQAEELRRELFARKQNAAAAQAGTAPAAAAASQAAAPASAHPLNNVLDAPAEIWDDVRGVFGGAGVDTGRVTYEYGLTNKELVFTGLSNNTGFLVVVIGIVGGLSQFVGQMAPIVAGVAEPVVGNMVSMSVKLFGGNAIAAGVAAFMLGAVVLWALSAVGTCLAFGGFRARRRDSRIEVERGLLQHQFQGVDIDRVQSVVVRQSFIRRLLGYCELSLGKIDAVSDNQDAQQQSQTQQGLVIHPFVKLNRVPEILAGIVPEFADVPANNTPVAPVALRRALIRRCLIQGSGLWLAVIVAVTQLCFNVFSDPSVPDQAYAVGLANMGAIFGYVLAVVLLICDAVGAVLWFRGSGFAYNRRFMQVSNGGLARETISFPRKKIQFGYTKTNPFQRNAGTATINARTAAGVGGTTIRLIDATEEDARAWLEWLEPRGNVIQ
ncbi:PH domain-containing protein [Arabiibacter massiliensis]|uniref:PH domain-containing protein n=1 Tax=Arabiibacter massiliensis TaxID=1870985 RepID=UPI0009BC0B6A|nr:PH domain-containing protein [Arabiibacter massiliensis]